MPVEIQTINVKCFDPDRVARFWLNFLGYEVAANHTASIQTTDPTGHGPAILFAPWNAEDIPEKSRMHFDIRPDDQDQAVARALRLGARQVEDARETGKSWVVMQDPEGNAFCILASRADYERLLESDPGTITPVDGEGPSQARSGGAPP
ncbi:MAG: VOC family protein [Conexibacter sp.]